MSLDLAFDDGQLAIADSVAQFCAEQCGDEVVKASTGSFQRELWSGLAGLGVLGLLAPDGGGGALEAVAALEPLGRAAFPGPLIGTFVATHVLDAADCARVAAGDEIVSLGSGALLPWGAEAGVFLEVVGEEIVRARAQGVLSAVDTLGGEPWARGELEGREGLALGRGGLVLARLLRAAQLAGMGRRLVDDASRHAADRKQFGKPIGDFQAVAFPLAACAIRLDAAAQLARVAAFHFDESEVDDAPRRARRFAAAAHESACAAALEAAYAVHQVFGAVGITLEGPVFHVSRRIRQGVAEAPSRDSSRDVLLEDAGFGPPDTRAAS